MIETKPSRRSVLAAALLLPLAGCGAPAAAPPAPAAPATQTPARTDRLPELERRFDARLGVYAVDTGSGRELAHRADEPFAMCSVFKALAAAAVLQRTPPEYLDERVHFTEADLIDPSPIAAQHVAEGMTVRELCDAAVRYSDNAAGNLLLADVGGPAGITAFARSLGDEVTRLDRTEPELNTAIPGDERDTTTPRAIAGSLRALVLGDHLDPADRALFTEWLVGNRTGDERIRAGLPAGWRVGDKTGTGSYGTANDVAVLWPPDAAPIAVAVLTSRAAEDATRDEALLAEAAAVVAQELG
ncbi:class A beta-lactamase BlaC [Pseudonocardia adelaidensis]|uniref:Beta-lactamase n=1 Tax=Pseudonocardia adelaidensis TaxID=648754 RepID=A0ABP9NJ98_9PSEU